MLVKFLSEVDKEHLLELAKLLSVADNPLLWDGKRKEEITSKTNLRNISIENDESESVMIAELESELGLKSERKNLGVQITRQKPLLSSDTAVKLIEKLKTFPLHTVEEPATRTEAALSVLRELVENKKFERPSAPKLILFELMLVALCGRSISNIEWAILKEFQCHHRLEDFIFTDLLERAETMSREVNKTISIILE